MKEKKKKYLVLTEVNMIHGIVLIFSDLKVKTLSLISPQIS